MYTSFCDQFSVFWCFNHAIISTNLTCLTYRKQKILEFNQKGDRSTLRGQPFSRLSGSSISHDHIHHIMICITWFPYQMIRHVEWLFLWDYWIHTYTKNGPDIYYNYYSGHAFKQHVYTTFSGHPEVSVTSRCVLRNSPSQTTMKYAPTCFLLIVSDNVWYHSYYSVSALFRWNFDADPNVVLLRAITCAMI